MTLLHPSTPDPDGEAVPVAEQCRQFGEILGIGEPVAESVLAAAIENPTYATNLLVCRGRPDLLATLLSRPPRRRDAAAMSSGELMRKGVEALWRWGRTGFSVVEDAVLQRRLAACETCPNLSSPPADKKLLYVLAGSMGTRQPVCRRCGCVVTRKARLPGESCPDPHPELPGVSRWSEPAVQTPAHP
jgi:hypothetical protein